MFHNRTRMRAIDNRIRKSGGNFLTLHHSDFLGVIIEEEETRNCQHSNAEEESRNQNDLRDSIPKETALRKTRSDSPILFQRKRSFESNSQIKAKIRSPLDFRHLVQDN